MKHNSTPKSQKLAFSLQDFGQRVDYSLFSVFSDLSFFRFVALLGEQLHCTFSLLEPFSPTISSVAPKFKRAFATFDSQGRSEQFAYSVVDKLSVVVLENRTQQFDRDQLITRDRAMPTLFDTQPLEEDIYYYALNDHDFTAQKWLYHDVRFLLFAFAKKTRGVDLFAQHLALFNSRANPFQLVQLPHQLYAVNAASTGHSTKSALSIQKFLLELFMETETKISHYLAAEKRKASDLNPTRKII